MATATGCIDIYKLLKMYYSYWACYWQQNSGHSKCLDLYKYAFY